MKEFSELYHSIKSNANREEIVHRIRTYFSNISDAEKDLALTLLLKKFNNRLASKNELIEWARQGLEYSSKVWQVSLQYVKDPLELIGLSWPSMSTTNVISLHELFDKIDRLKSEDVEKRKSFVTSIWNSTDTDTRVFINQLIAGNYQLPLPKESMIFVLSDVIKIRVDILFYRIWKSQKIKQYSFAELSENANENHRFPLPKNWVRKVVIENTDDLRNPSDYSIEPEWSGIEVQLVNGNNELHIWKEDGTLLTDKFPEFQKIKKNIPDGIILQGYMIIHRDGLLMPVSLLEKRIKRTRVTPKLLSENPVFLCVTDVINFEYRGLKTIEEEAKIIEEIVEDLGSEDLIKMSEDIMVEDWADLESKWRELKPLHVNGVNIKKKSMAFAGTIECFTYRAPRQKLKGVLLYVKRGDGALANRFVQFTIGVKYLEKIVPVARFEPKLSSREILEIKSFVNNHRIERFGPVISVEAKLIFEISFQSVEISSRRKCGIELKDIQYETWCRHEEAVCNSLEDIQDLLIH